MNLLSDSNKLLREDRDRLAVQLREAETRVSIDGYLENPFDNLKKGIKNVKCNKM